MNCTLASVQSGQAPSARSICFERRGQCIRHVCTHERPPIDQQRSSSGKPGHDMHVCTSDADSAFGEGGGVPSPHLLAPDDADKAVWSGAFGDGGCSPHPLSLWSGGFGEGGAALADVLELRVYSEVTSLPPARGAYLTARRQAGRLPRGHREVLLVSVSFHGPEQGVYPEVTEKCFSCPYLFMVLSSASAFRVRIFSWS